MVKVVRIPLISNNPIDYQEINKILWKLQDQTRVIKNKTIQYAWEWNNFSADYKKEYDSYPDLKEVLNYSFSGYVYDKLKADSDLNTSNLTCTIRAAEAQFNAAVKDYVKGDRSIQEYKANQPLELHNKTIKLEYDNNNFFFKISLCNKNYAKENNISTQIMFRALVKSGSQKAILERCYDGVYKISASKMIYDKKKKAWFLNLSYGFTKENLPELDKNKILGVDLGVALPVVASVYNEKGRLTIQKGEIEHFRKKVETRRNSILQASAISGKGRKGHGYNTRVKTALQIGDKVARFRDTLNHKYSKALVDYAVKNRCGTIQMEDLKGITNKADRFLKNWSYFDLQTKVEYKAKEQGIDVVYIKPYYTSKRCSKCGFIHEDNRTEQAKFKCLNCGFETNADYNASQNIAIKDIDKIISASMKRS